ncbi:50S ribosomal protein L15 [Roseibium algicola]|uniref:Large ribosomal subunit protein uL15 n=1 Tax=Roseibium algicola TaxID=2857014 RepID=A0ABN4WVC2_9HYPH|nr:50S ribosomal protein L15 [Roseibium aggregatum]AQQ04122.1 50S ribosomal protein L15 [Roseibium aggregatum]
MIRLNKLSDRPGSTRQRRRKARGIGTGKGKTAGRGHKGQKSRSGASLFGQEGGQNPLVRRLPKRGFTSRDKTPWCEINLQQIQEKIDQHRLDINQTIDEDALFQAGLMRRGRMYARVLGVGELKQAIELHVAHSSKGARSKIERSGGKVKNLASAVKNLDSKHLYGLYNKEVNIKEAIQINFEGVSMYLKSNVDRYNINATDTVNVDIEVRLDDTEKMIEPDLLSELSILFDGYGIESEVQSLDFSQIYNDISSRNVFNSTVKYHPTETGSLDILVNIMRGHERIARTRHTLDCE